MTSVAAHPAPYAPGADWRPALLPTSVDRSLTPPLRRLRAVLLLAGSVRPSRFLAGIGRSVLDLPWDGGRTIFDLWCVHVLTLARLVRWERPAVQLLVDQKCLVPRRTRPDGLDVIVRRDRAELRGSGGLLRDVAEAYADDDYLLVAHGAQVLREPLTHYALAAAADGGDVGLIAHHDDSPISVWLVRCGCLRRIAPVGYVDFMEQGLPLIAESHEISVTLQRKSTGLSVRTHTDYIRALRAHHRRPNGGAVAADPLAEDWEPRFRLDELGAHVDPRADVFDSVILAGARVEPGATVLRSVVCPGALVCRGERVIDQLVDNRRASAFAAAALSTR